MCVQNTTAVALVRATPTCEKCAVRRAVKVIRRRVRERTIEKNYIKYVHIKYIYRIIADLH